MKNDSTIANTRRWKEQRSIRQQLLPETQRNNDARKKNAERETFPVVTEMNTKEEVMEMTLPDII